MVTWYPNLGYMPIDATTKIHGRLEGESREEALKFRTAASGYRWEIDKNCLANLIEYAIAED